MLKTNWQVHAVPYKVRHSQAWLVKRAGGEGAPRHRKITGAHKFMTRTEREALCRKLEGRS